MWSQQTPAKDVTTEDVPRVPNSRPIEERRTTAWVGKSVVFKGELFSSEDMVIDGRVEGAIEVRDHSLTIGPDADIRADIAGKVVIVHGKVRGHITANGKVQLFETAFVEGDISSPRFVMAEGARLLGRVETAKHPAEVQIDARVAPAF